MTYKLIQIIEVIITTTNKKEKNVLQSDIWHYIDNAPQKNIVENT